MIRALWRLVVDLDAMALFLVLGAIGLCAFLSGVASGLAVSILSIPVTLWRRFTGRKAKSNAEAQSSPEGFTQTSTPVDLWAEAKRNATQTEAPID